jgi:hypothetical protein
LNEKIEKNKISDGLSSNSKKFNKDVLKKQPSILSFIGKKFSQKKYIVENNQPQIVEYVDKPSSSLIEKAAEVKYKVEKQPRTSIYYQFKNYGKPKFNTFVETIDENSEEEENLELDLIQKDISESLSDEIMVNQFVASPSLSNSSLYEKLFQKQISHYQYLTDNTLISVISQQYLSSMMHTLYSNKYSSFLINEAIEKVKKFWFSILDRMTLKN